KQKTGKFCVMQGLSSGQRKKKLAFARLGRILAQEWISTMRMLASIKWLGARVLCPGFTGKRGIRNRGRHGAQRCFRPRDRLRGKLSTHPRDWEIPASPKQPEVSQEILNLR